MRSLLISTMMAGAALVATPAGATVIVCTGANCVNTDENVLVDKNDTPSNLVTGSTQSGVNVNFTSTTDLLIGAANGQATIDAQDGLLNNLTFSMLDGYSFGSAIFNLEGYAGNIAGEATSVLLAYYDPALKTFGTLAVKTNGQNFFGIYGDAGERFYGVTISGDPITTGWGQLKQLRVGGVGIAGMVPEPATWAMMILGMGAVGAAMRRRKVRVNYSMA